MRRGMVVVAVVALASGLAACGWGGGGGPTACGPEPNDDEIPQEIVLDADHVGEVTSCLFGDSDAQDGWFAIPGVSGTFAITCTAANDTVRLHIAKNGLESSTPLCTDVGAGGLVVVDSDDEIDLTLIGEPGVTGNLLYTVHIEPTA